MIKVYDNLSECVPPVKPIELLYCLQHTNNNDADLIMAKAASWKIHESWREITRIGQVDNDASLRDGKFDVISVMGRACGPQMLFLGHWNDGIVG